MAARHHRVSAPVPLGALVLALALLLAACGGDEEPAPAPAPSETTQGGTTTEPEPDDTSPADLQVSDVATGLEIPWGIDFLPGGDALITERDSGRLLRLDPKSGETTEVQTIDVNAEGEGGLLGIAVSPDYESDKLVYAYYTTGEDNRIARFELGSEPEPIVTGISAAPIHDGGQLRFGPDGMLYASTGDAGDGDLAQDQGSLNGKILRMTPEGEPPSDNPFDGSLVYSLGHRNVQGLAWDAEDRLYATEFGDSSADEVNLIEPGANYGWPEVEGEGGGSEFTGPITIWEPSEASPAGGLIPSEGAPLAGDMLVAALAGARLWRLELNDSGQVADRQSLFEGELGRIRTVVETPDGEVWLATSNRDGRGDPQPGDDRIVRLEPGS